MSFWKRNDPPSPYPEPEQEQPRTSLELLAESVALLKQSLKLEAEESIAALKDAHAADEALLASAQQTADELGLREAMVTCMERLACHHSWIKQDDKYRTPGRGIYIKDGSTTKEDRTDHIGLFLTVEGRLYVLSWERSRSYYDGEIMGVGRFSNEQGQTLFAMDFGTTYEYEMEHVQPGVVTRLDLGEWVHDFIRLSERLTAGHEQEMLEMRARYTAEKAKDI